MIGFLNACVPYFKYILPLVAIAAVVACPLA